MIGISRTLLLYLVAMVTSCSNMTGPEPQIVFAAEADHSIDNSVELTTFAGPGYYCGLGFAINLYSQEKLVRQDRQMDFVTHRLSSESGSVLIYEGNFPQEADKYVRTGMNFPSVVALHLGDNEQGYDADELAKRIETGTRYGEVCQGKARS